MNSSVKPSFHWGRWLSIGIITIVIVWFAQQVILKPIIEAVSSQVIGAKVELGSFSLNIFTHQIRITNFKIYNEQGFSPQVFFNASEILVDIDLPQTLKGKLHCPLVIFRLDKMIIFKNAQGKLNVNELKIVQEKLHDKNKGPAPNFKIDVLKLNIEQVIVEDEGKTPPLVQAYNVDLKDKTILNVNGVPKLVGSVLFEAMKPTALRGAGMFAATTLLGVGFLPGLAIGLVAASDDAVADLPYSYDQVYQHSLALVNRLGQLKAKDDLIGKITAKIYDCDITIEIEKKGWNTSKVTVKARKYFLAKQDIAGGMLYQLKEDLQ